MAPWRSPSKPFSPYFRHSPMHFGKAPDLTLTTQPGARSNAATEPSRAPLVCSQIHKSHES
jgi:hypothetical protein